MKLSFWEHGGTERKQRYLCLGYGLQSLTGCAQQAEGGIPDPIKGADCCSEWATASRGSVRHRAIDARGALRTRPSDSSQN